ncbi:MAG TPA: glycosyltransferase [Chloroflexota bacterium]|nr:glycosyltransferase [Chloroflexota bacterium]
MTAGSHVLAQTSLMEGSCNSMCEALVLGTPVIASRISGLIGTLGEDYPGYFSVQDERELADQLRRAETDAAFYDDLRERCQDASRLLTPEREMEAWNKLLAELL